VVRGGIGNFRDFLPQQVLQGFALNTPNVNAFTVNGLTTGSALSPAVAGNVFATAASYNTTFVNGFSQGATLADLQASDPGFSPPAYYGAQHKTINPTYVEWNLEVQRSLDQNTTVSANYVGNHGIHEVFINPGLNAYDPGGFVGLPTAAPDARFSNVTELQTDGTSNYNGVTFSARHNFSHSFQATASYTYSHALDDVSDNGFTAWSYGTAPSIQYPQDPFNPHANYGNNDVDVRHAFSGSYVWTPSFDSWSGHDGNKFLAGWSFSGTFFYRSGFPFTVTDGANTATLAGFNYGATLFANYLSGAQPSCSSPTSPCLEAADFSSAVSAFGDQRRNQFRGPGFFNTDLGILKRTRVRLWSEGQQFVVGASFYNILNHPNFDQPVADVANSSQFGHIIQTVSPPTSILGSGLGGSSSPRQIQLTAKFVF
jgi:hypothetical protein